jgi:hypothetical protein
MLLILEIAAGVFDPGISQAAADRAQLRAIRSVAFQKSGRAGGD